MPIFKLESCGILDCSLQTQALIEQLLLYVHERLIQGQTAEAVFAHLFAKQRGLLPT